MLRVAPAVVGSFEAGPMEVIRMQLRAWFAEADVTSEEHVRR